MVFQFYIFPVRATPEEGTRLFFKAAFMQHIYVIDSCIRAGTLSLLRHFRSYSTFGICITSASVLNLAGHSSIVPNSCCSTQRVCLDNPKLRIIPPRSEIAVVLFTFCNLACRIVHVLKYLKARYKEMSTKVSSDEQCAKIQISLLDPHYVKILFVVVSRLDNFLNACLMRKQGTVVSSWAFFRYPQITSAPRGTDTSE